MSDTPPEDTPATEPVPPEREAPASNRGLITFVILALLFGGAKIARRVFKAAKHAPTGAGKHVDELADGGRAVAREADAVRHGGDGVGAWETVGEAKDAHDVTELGGKVSDALSDDEEPEFEDADPFLELLADDQAATRVMGAEQLGTIRCDSEAVEALTAALDDSDLEVRCAAARSLGLLGELAESARPALAQAAEAGDPKLEPLCRTALRQIEAASH